MLDMVPSVCSSWSFHDSPPSLSFNIKQFYAPIMSSMKYAAILPISCRLIAAERESAPKKCKTQRGDAPKSRHSRLWAVRSWPNPLAKPCQQRTSYKTQHRTQNTPYTWKHVSRQKVFLRFCEHADIYSKEAGNIPRRTVFGVGLLWGPMGLLAGLRGAHSLPAARF